MPVFLLAIESSCDDTSAAVLLNGKVLSNVVASQAVHAQYGGVVPELASRSHLAHIVPAVDLALQQANITKHQLDCIAFTQGPGLLGSLLVGSSFAKSLALALKKPLIAVNHMEAHIMAHYIEEAHIPESDTAPQQPFICLTVSGGHTQLVLVNGPLQFELLGETRDDAAGEAFDKAAKLLGLPYPGGPELDRLAESGNPAAFKFAEPKLAGWDFSFSGLKTSLLYFLQKQTPEFIEIHKPDIAASFRMAVIHTLLVKLEQAVQHTGIRAVAIAGGVSANRLLRKEILRWKTEKGHRVYIPQMAYCTDNAAMIGITALYKFYRNDFASQSTTPQARWHLGTAIG